MENISISTILMENHILSIVGNRSQRTNCQRQKAMLVTQEIGEAGRYEFGFAGKYRGRVSF